jgi:hypothetical protein
MELETEYIEYGIQLSLALIGVTLAYFIDPSQPATLLGLIFVPILYGYTAYISHEGFSHSALMSLPALIFVITGGLTAVLAVFYSIGNILVSLFSHGTQFKDFYGSTSLPLLILGLLTGTSVFLYASFVPGVQDDLAETAGQKVGEFSGDLVSDMNLIEDQKRAQMRLVNSTSRSAVALTRQKVLSEVEITPELQNSFATAEQNVTEQVYRNAASRLGEQEVDISEKMSETLTQQFKRMNFIIVVPLITGIFYTLQPLIGILTGIFGKLSLLLDG